MNNIRIATSIKYGNYKSELSRSKELANRIKQYWSTLVEHIGLEESMLQNFEILIRPIKAETVNGRYFHEGVHVEPGKPSRIELDPRYDSFKHLMGVLAHEFQHLKQYCTGKITHERENVTGKWLSYWKGNKQSSGSTWNTYRSQPWEVEARQVQESFEVKYITARMKDPDTSLNKIKI